MRLVREMHDHVEAVETPRPVGVGTDVADGSKLETRNRLCRATRQSGYGVAAFGETATHRASDKAGGTGHQDSRQAPRSAPRRGEYFHRLGRKCIREAPVPITIADVPK
jgi:hypothetical protein